MVWETNNFNGGVGNWTITQNDTANGNNVGWQNSGNAGGARANWEAFSHGTHPRLFMGDCSTSP
jgi:hypothetical protein